MGVGGFLHIFQVMRTTVHNADAVKLVSFFYSMLTYSNIEREKMPFIGNHNWLFLIILFQDNKIFCFSIVRISIFVYIESFRSELGLFLNQIYETYLSIVRKVF